MMRILSALLLAGLLSSGCERGERLMPPESLIPQEPVEAICENLNIIADEARRITADEARQRPMVEGSYFVAPDRPSLVAQSSSDRLFPCDVGYLVLSIQNPPPMSPYFVTHVDVYYRRSDVQIVSEEPSIASEFDPIVVGWNPQTTFGPHLNHIVVE